MLERPTAPRKLARQARSKRTVNMILSAAAHILKHNGPGGLTTNHIAQEANISVGSIYQYFPNKHAILLSLMRLQIERANTQKPARLDGHEVITLDERIASSVRWHLDTGREDPLLFQRLFEAQREILTTQERRQFDRYHEDAVFAGLQAHAKEIRIKNLRTAALVVSQFLVAATQSATASQPCLLNDAEYESQIVDALLCYLR